MGAPFYSLGVLNRLSKESDEDRISSFNVLSIPTCTCQIGTLDSVQTDSYVDRTLSLKYVQCKRNEGYVGSKCNNMFPRNPLRHPVTSISLSPVGLFLRLSELDMVLVSGESSVSEKTQTRFHL